MTKRRFTPWIALACIGTLAACTSGEGGTAGNTELNVIVPNGSPALGGGSSAPALIDIQSVEYTINCLGNSDVFLENLASFPDEVTINGNLEVVDGRTNADANLPPNPDFGPLLPNDQSEVWQAFMDLPPGPCTVQLRARDGDGEVICTATEPFTITADNTTKVNLILICDLSFQAPVGMLDVDATFEFNVGNFCPDLFILNCLDSLPAADFPHPAFPGTCSTAGTTCFVDTDCPSGETCIGNVLLATTTCEVRFRDGASTCGQGCDPQSCVPTPEGLTCTPGPDPGVSTTITCTDLTIDCDLNPITPETSCIYNGDTLGILGVGQGNPATFAVACTPPALGGTAGVIGQCTAVTTDGDLDCDKTKVVDVTCPGLSPCAQLGCTPGADCAFCDDGDLCTSDVCNDTGGTAVCPGDLNPVGTPCDVADPTATCDAAGACQSGDCNLVGGDPFCDDLNDCTTNTCDAPPGTACSTANNPSGSACDAGAGASSGACDGAATCVDICTFNAPCPDDSNICTVPACDPANGACSLVAGNEGVTCDFTGPGSADGVCQTGGCIFAPPTCNFVQTGSDLTPQTQIVGVGCTNNVTAAQSPFPFILTVDVPVSILAAGAFSANLDGIGFFPEFFLDAAQGVVCGGLRTAQLVDFVSTVQVRSGAAGADVPLTIDLATLSPGEVSFCNFPDTQVCVADSECLGGTCEPPIILQDLPVLDGIPLAPGGCTADTSNCPIPGPPVACDCSACDALGGAKIAQCADNGFCQDGSLVLQMQDDVGNYVAAATGPVLWGWSDQGVPGLSICPVGTDCGTPGRVDGCYQLPPASFALPTPPIGIRVDAGGLAVPIQCAMGEDGGTCSVTFTTGCLTDGDCPGVETCIGVGVDDDVICPTPDAVLIACPVN